MNVRKPSYRPTAVPVPDDPYKVEIAYPTRRELQAHYGAQAKRPASIPAVSVAARERFSRTRDTIRDHLANALMIIQAQLIESAPADQPTLCGPMTLKDACGLRDRVRAALDLVNEYKPLALMESRAVPQADGTPE